MLKKRIVILITLFINIVEVSDKKLSFNSDGEFTILYVTDLHIGDNSNDDKKSIALLRELIKESKPDLVVLGGDIISGYRWNRVSKNFFEINWKKFSDVFLEEKVYYAYALGNHDVEADLDCEEVMKLDKTNPYSLFEKDMSGDKKSESNFNVKIYSSLVEEEITSLIWIFDSKRHGCENRRFSYGCITKPQISWYEKDSKKINENQDKIVKGFSFFHIPLPEMKDLWNDYETYGDKKEYVYCPKVNTGLFEKVVDIGNMKGIFVGHDHNNDFGGFIKGVELAYNRKTGYGNYGKLVKGGRVLKLKEFIDENGHTDFTYTNYILEKGGKIVQNKKMKKHNYKKQRFCKRIFFF